MNNTIDPGSYDQGKRDILLFLIGVAQNTQGSEVWRALFAAILGKLGE